ncbi:hypothetical protein BKA61DRAFT_179973 [Leptodontidium sp. MPI-SDFR-AT-0119]|nr:hypothetical protein BKA61DRAFT_179973 [Leptodontidium sp. MPI-SDFR-AT-0119]
MTGPIPSGVYAPLPAFFNDQDELDLKAYLEHALYVAKPGVIPVVSATLGEAAHLDRQERIQLIKALRSSLDENDLHKTPIVAGVGATSARETISLAKDAAAAGAEFVLVIAPSYYATALKANPTAIKRFFIDVASQSPVPVCVCLWWEAHFWFQTRFAHYILGREILLANKNAGRNRIIYNYPVVSGGIDLTSDDVVDITTAAPNICSIMLSCGNIGKVSRITSLVDGSFKTLAGFIDFLLPAVSVGAAGAISPLPNIAPEFAMELWRATQSLDSAADWAKARQLQEKASIAEAELLKGGVAGLKYLLNQRFGYPAAPRLPLQPLSEVATANLSSNKYLKDLMAMN